jgi:hypothetical protein
MNFPPELQLSLFPCLLVQKFIIPATHTHRAYIASMRGDCLFLRKWFPIAVTRAETKRWKLLWISERTDNPGKANVSKSPQPQHIKLNQYLYWERVERETAALGEKIEATYIMTCRISWQKEGECFYWIFFNLWDSITFLVHY